MTAPIIIVSKPLKGGTFLEIGEEICRHNAMVERMDDNVHAWECADCGYIYGTEASRQ